jgi:hypothetical protein
MQNSDGMSDVRSKNKQKRMAILIGAPLAGLLLLLLLGRLVGDQKPAANDARGATQTTQNGVTNP